MKSRNIITVLGAGIVAVGLGFTSVSAQTSQQLKLSDAPKYFNTGAIGPRAQTQGQPLQTVLNPDGTLNLEDGFSGSLDPTGWRMVTGPDGEPRFVPSGTPESGLPGASPMFAPGDENWDDQFNAPGVNSTVTAIAISGSDVYVGGFFTAAGSVSANHIAKWNGSSWSALGSGVDNNVMAIAVNGSDVYVGGNFTTAGGVSANRIARWNGSSWSALGDGVDQSVYAIAIDGSDVYVGGSFISSGVLGANRIAKWNGSSWSALGNGVNNPVLAIAIDGSDVYVGGIFTSAGGVSVNRIAKWNGSSWSALGSGVDNQVKTIAINGSDVYVGGRFTTAGGVSANRIAKWNTISSIWSALGSGADNDVSIITISESDVYVGGAFSLVGGVSASRIAKWNGSSWSSFGSGNGVGAAVNAIVIDVSDVYVGGAFIAAGGVSTSRIAKWNGSSWSSFGSGNGLNTQVITVAIEGNDVYVGGLFTFAGGVSANRIAKWDGNTWSALGDGLNNGVHGIAVSGSDVYVAGIFTTAGGVSANRVAKWNGSTWSALGNGVDNNVLAIAANGSDVYVGGILTFAGGVSANRIAKWDGSTWSALGSGLNNSVHAIAVSGSDVYVGGTFTTAGGVNASRIAKWDGSTWSALGSGIDDIVMEIATNGGDVYVGGGFTMAGGVSANNIAKWDGSTWSAFGDGIDGGVYAIAFSGSDVYVGGTITAAGGVSASNVAKWDGSTWSALGSGVDNNVFSIAINVNDMFVGGLNLFAGGKPSNCISRWSIPAGNSLTFTVTNTGNSGTGSLQQSIEDANTNPGLDVIAFNIPGAGPHTIQPSSALPTITDPVIIDGYTQPGASVNSNAPGLGSNAVLKIELDGSSAGSTHGLNILSENCTIRGLVINRYTWNAIQIEMGNNTIEGNFLGVDVTGQIDNGNQRYGVYINNQSENIIGGTAPGAGNVISGNNLGGIYATGTSASGNQIEGNYIGTDRTGELDVGNSNDGIAISGPGNVVGGTSANARNIISGNDRYGVYIFGAAAQSNVISGNYVGIKASGTEALGNTEAGIKIDRASWTMVGGWEDGAENVISGNFMGVFIEGTPATGFFASSNFIIGNLIGTDYTGSEAVPNTEAGVALFNATDNVVGGASADSSNVISGNHLGVNIFGSEATGNHVRGNTIGLNAAGDALLGNDTGVYIAGSSFNTVGGIDTGAGNVISGNGNGISLAGSDATENDIIGNFIGTDASGILRLANAGDGIYIWDAVDNTIGGTAPEARNIIAGNQGNGIRISGPNASGNIVQGNHIGINATGTDSIGNSWIGVSIVEGANNNTIGGTTADTRNVISGNYEHGININGAFTSGNIIQGNYIGTNAAGDAGKGNWGEGVLILEAPANIVGGSDPGAGNLISANVSHGIEIQGALAVDNIVQGNYVGTNATGTERLGNNNGIGIFEAPNTTVGGTSIEARNVISGNNRIGIEVIGINSAGSIIQGNYIGINATGDDSLGNSSDGVVLNGAPNITIGGIAPNAGNVISGNYVHGISLMGEGASGNVIQGNKIGTNAAGDDALGNFNPGIAVYQSDNTLIGGDTPGAGNLISGNYSHGILVLDAATSTTMIQGNYIGTNAAGTEALGNDGEGVLILEAPGTIIGGPSNEARNLISGNLSHGIEIQGATATGTTVVGNYIGTNAAGDAALGNNYGVCLVNAPDNTVGYQPWQWPNVISGNEINVAIIGSGASGNHIKWNYIGTTAANESGISGQDYGVSIWNGSTNNIIESNFIAHHTLDGVQVYGADATGNAIYANFIYSNGELGIDLGADGVTLNDSGDGDNGGSNLFQNYPELSSAQIIDDEVWFDGILDSEAVETYRLDFYSSTAQDPSGYGEGEKYLGYTEVFIPAFETDVSFSIPFPSTIVTEGHYVSVTATDAENNTSEFSLSIPIVTGAPVSTPPSIAAYQPTGTQSRDISISYVISDEQGDPVDLVAEYSVDSGTSWIPATVDGVITGIQQTQYDGQLVWRSATDLLDKDLNNIWFRMIPSDAEAGVADTTFIDVDNEAPRWMVVEGVARSSELRFWFDETVSETEVLDAVNYTLAASLTIDVISPVDDWSAVNSLNFARIDAASGVMNDLLYVAGGSSGGTQQVGHLEAYNPTIGNWTTLEPMETPRRGPVGGTIDGKFYVAGGYDTAYHDILEVYDPVTDKWSGRDPMPTPRMWAASAVIEGRLYVVGGETDSGITNVLEVYDPSTNEWDDTLRPADYARRHLQAGVIDGKMYVVGGVGDTGYSDVLEVYDPGTDDWYTLKPLPTARRAPAVGVVGNKLIVSGGYNGTDYLNIVEIYDPVTNSWVTRHPMEMARERTASGVINGKLYVAGGQDGSAPLNVVESYNTQDHFVATLADGQTLPSEILTLSTGDVPDVYGNAAGYFQVEFEPASSFIVVTNTDDSGTGSLRQAIIDAYDIPGKDVIQFAIPETDPGFNSDSGAYTIALQSALPAITDTVVIDGFSQAGSSPNTSGPGQGTNAVLKIILDGSGVGQPGNGLTILAGDCTVKGLVIHSFDGAGVSLEGGEGSIVEGNYIGTDVSGAVDLGNARQGVYIGSSGGNQIGGTYRRSRNIISGNDGIGIFINEVSSGGNEVFGNFIGVDAAGTGALGNAASGVAVLAPDNIIGGATSAHRNIISANEIGIGIERITGIRNTVIGNFIGTDLTGKMALGNTMYGVVVYEGAFNTIGGAVEGEGNVISANTGHGIHLQDNAHNNTIQGNFLGTDVTGTIITDSEGASLGNSQGVSIDASPNNIIGGVYEGAGNVISGNGEGILLRDVGQSNSCNGNIIKGNWIGTDVTGQEDLGNLGNGIRLGSGDPSKNMIGGQEGGAGNIIAFNGAAAIAIESGSGNAVLSNIIHSNGNLGIDLDNADNPGDVTPNDIPDDDGYQNYPVLTSTSYGPGTVTVSGTLESLVDTEFILEFFANSTDFPAGVTGGERLLGSSTVMTNGSGYSEFTETFNITNDAGDFITATATAPDSSTSEFSIVLQTSVLEVFNTNDSGPGSLRDLIEIANNGDLRTIVFNIPESDGGYNVTTGTWTIQPLNVLSDITVPVTIDGYSQPGASANTNLIDQGSNAVLKIVLSGANIDTTIAALHITGGKSVIRGLVINDWHATGILVSDVGENTIEGCFIGTDASGLTARANTGHGIWLANSATNVIGGTIAAARNVISGNSGRGVKIQGEGSAGNQVQGNYLGLNALGNSAIANLGQGVTIFNAPNNVIGGDTPEKRNIISGNIWSGVGIYHAKATGNLVKGNIIGLDATGETAIPNETRGIVLYNAPANTIGGSTPGSGNVISGNLISGIIVSDSTATDNLIQGNFIGTDVTGTIAIGNHSMGVYIWGASYNTIGGIREAERNIISGNLGDQVQIADPASIHNIIAGNFIGTDVTGMEVLGDGSVVGIRLNDCIENLVGGSERGARNIISGNLIGVVIQGPAESPAPRNNWVSGNFIGTDVSGTKDLGNTQDGLFISAAHENTIGGTIRAEANLISGNDNAGILLIDDSSQNKILGNLIGTDITGTKAIPNRIGVDLVGAIDNQVGGMEPGEGNLISGNAENGMGLLMTSTTGNIIQGNNIGADITGVNPLGNGISGIGMGVPGASGNMIGGVVPEAGNLIVYNGHDGITILEGTANTIFFNIIHSNKDLGIDLNGDWISINDNDDYDADDGANNLQNYPELTSVSYSADSITIEGTLTSIAENDYYLQFFANQHKEESGHGQGFVYLGGDTINTGATGVVTFTSTFPASGAEGVYISATATDAAGNTSEFSPQSATPVFIVKNAGNSGDGSLRWAIEQANLDEGTDTIVFDIPESDQGFNSYSGVYTIALESELDELLYPIVLDGSSQPGFTGDPIIALDGAGIAGGADGLRLTGGNSVIRSLVIGNFDGHGIHIIGGGSGLGGNLIAGSYIGVDSTATQKSTNSGSGIRISNSPDNMVGGSTLLAANIIAGNAQHGIHLSGSGTRNNRIFGNFIGSNPAADTGIENGGNGVLFSDEGDGEPSDNSVGGEEDEKGNIITDNGGHGVAVYAGTGNRINSNFIHTNSGRGISLTAEGNPTPDDEGDEDTGPNGLQNSPLLTFAQSYPYYIEGELSSAADTEYRIEFFLNLDDDPLDPNGRSEGEIYLGSVRTMTTGIGVAGFSGSFEGPLSNNLFITATATDPDGNTSEFSLPISTTLTSKAFGDHYVLNTSYAGIPLHWERGVSDFVVSESVPEHLRQAVVDGIKAWGQLGQLEYTYKGLTNSTQWSGDLDGINNNTWITEGWEEATGTDASISALTRVRYNAITGVMTDVDVTFNAQHHQWSVGQEPGTMDVASVSTHEAGHFSGLADIYDPDDPGYLPAMGSGNSEQTMFGLILADETKKRTLNFGDRAGIEAIYGFLVKTGLDIVLVFDGSESYTTNYEAFEDARRSSLELLDKLRVGDRISVIQLPSSVIFPLTEITTDPQWREGLKDAIMGMVPTGGTSVALGSGLDAAQNQLLAVFDESRQTQAIILLSAGEENMSPTARAITEGSIEATGTEIYTIGMAGSEAVTLLSELADVTGGKYYLALDASDIPDKMDRIWEHLLGWQMLYQEMNSTEDLEGIPYPGLLWEGGLGLRWQGELGLRWQGETGIRWQGETGIRWQGGWGLRWQGETGLRWQGETGLRWQGELGIRWQGETGLRWQGETGLRWQGVMIDASTTDSEIGLRWQGSDLDLTLQDPDGNWITPEVAAVTDSIEYVTTATYEYYRIHNPMPGVWTVWIYGKDLPIEPEPYTIYVAVHTDLTMEVEFDSERYQAGEDVLITTILQVGGESQGGIDLTGGAPITDATVYALYQVPESLYLRAFNLEHRGNGEYSAVFSPPEDTLGTYRFWIVAEGSDPEGDGRGFFRTSEHSIHVAEAHASDIVTIKNVIFGLPDDAFKKPANNRRNTFSEKLDELRILIDSGDIQEALDKLVHDIRAKMDGSFGGTTKDDWIISDSGQAAVYPEVTAFIEALAEESGTAVQPVTPELIEEDIPVEFGLSQNYPNPFNLQTQIQYSLPSPERVQLYIYDIRGRLIKVLVDEEKSAGHHTVRWDGRDSSGYVVSSGIYIYLFKAGRDVVSRKMTIIK